MSPKVKEEAESGRTGTKRKNSGTERETDDYKKRRNKNNVAVRKSREKTRAKAKETQEKVARLKKENEDLEMKVQLLSKELSLLKDLFLSHASSMVPDTYPRQVIKEEPQVEVKNEDEEVEEEEEELEEEIECVTLNLESPVNQEGYENDHEYFSHRARIYAK